MAKKIDRHTDDCPDNPGTGTVYYCNSLDCLVHGERNRRWQGKIAKAVGISQEEKVLAGIEAAVRPNSWRLGCKTRGESEWAYNALRFPTREACLKYGSDLYSRWTALDTYEAHPSDDAPNMPG